MFTTGKLSPNNAAAKMVIAVPFRDHTSLAAVVVRVLQVPFSFLVERIAAYASAVTDAVTGIVGIVAPGTSIEGVTMVIGGTNTKYKVSVAFTALMPNKSATVVAGVVGTLPPIVNVPVTDNLVFSSAFTINVAAAAGVHWGAVRVQMDSTGTFSTKVSSADQAYTSETPAINAAPKPDAGFFDCGTISIEMATGTTFTAKTTALTGGNVTAVNYNGAATGFTNVCSADTVFEELGWVVAGAMVATVAGRSVRQAGGLLVVKETTDGSGSVTDGTLDVVIRAWPLDGEVPGF